MQGGGAGHSGRRPPWPQGGGKIGRPCRAVLQLWPARTRTAASTWPRRTGEACNGVRTALRGAPPRRLRTDPWPSRRERPSAPARSARPAGARGRFRAAAGNAPPFSPPTLSGGSTSAGGVGGGGGSAHRKNAIKKRLARRGRRFCPSPPPPLLPQGPDTILQVWTLLPFPPSPDHSHAEGGRRAVLRPPGRQEQRGCRRRPPALGR